MPIRTYQPGDEVQQVAVYNAAAAALPGFKPASAEEIRRRVRSREFSPETRFYAEEGGRVVGYAVLQPNGRASYPWCLPGHESAAGPLFDAVLNAARERGAKKLFAAYRGDWTAPLKFFEAQGFAKARDVVNFVQEMTEMPTMALRSSLPITPVRPEDLPAIAEMGAGVLRLPAAELERYFFSNPQFAAEALFVMRTRGDNKPVAVGIAVEDPSYADPRKVDVLAPCFRLGAFGTEGLSTKRINGLFSFLVARDRDMTSLGLDLLTYAADRLMSGTAEALAAQAPSDAPHLLAFYNRFFRKQGSFPVFERNL